MTRRNVLLDGEPAPPGERERFVEVPKVNDGMFAIELRNRGRVRRGTATIWRWRASGRSRCAACAVGKCWRQGGVP